MTERHEWPRPLPHLTSITQESTMELSHNTFRQRMAEAAQRINTMRVSAVADPDAPFDAESETAVAGFALRWFEQMRTGQIDRSMLSADYSAHLTDDAVEGMSRFLRAYEFGASPLGAHVLRKHAAGEQTFYVTKLLFPRGDAAALMFGFNAEGKITGVSLMSMAGD